MNKKFSRITLLVIWIFILTLSSTYAAIIKWSLQNKTWNFVNYICYDTPMTWGYFTCIMKYLDHENSFDAVSSWGSNNVDLSKVSVYDENHSAWDFAGGGTLNSIMTVAGATTFVSKKNLPSINESSKTSSAFAFRNPNWINTWLSIYVVDWFWAEYVISDTPWNFNVLEECKWANLLSSDGWVYKVTSWRTTQNKKTCAIWNNKIVYLNVKHKQDMPQSIQFAVKLWKNENNTVGTSMYELDPNYVIPDFSANTASQFKSYFSNIIWQKASSLMWTMTKYPSGLSYPSTFWSYAIHPYFFDLQDWNGKWLFDNKKNEITWSDLSSFWGPVGWVVAMATVTPDSPAISLYFDITDDMMGYFSITNATAAEYWSFAWLSKEPFWDALFQSQRSSSVISWSHIFTSNFDSTVYKEKLKANGETNSNTINYTDNLSKTQKLSPGRYYINVLPSWGWTFVLNQAQLIMRNNMVKISSGINIENRCPNITQWIPVCNAWEELNDQKNTDWCTIWYSCEKNWSSSNSCLWKNIETPTKWIITKWQNKIWESEEMILRQKVNYWEYNPLRDFVVNSQIYQTNGTPTYVVNWLKQWEKTSFSIKVKVDWNETNTDKKYIFVYLRQPSAIDWSNRFIWPWETFALSTIPGDFTNGVVGKAWNRWWMPHLFLLNKEKEFYLNFKTDWTTHPQFRSKFEFLSLTESELKNWFKRSDWLVIKFIWSSATFKWQWNDEYLNCITNQVNSWNIGWPITILPVTPSIENDPGTGLWIPKSNPNLFVVDPGLSSVTEIPQTINWGFRKSSEAKKDYYIAPNWQEVNLKNKNIISLRYRTESTLQTRVQISNSEWGSLTWYKVSISETPWDFSNLSCVGVNEISFFYPNSWNNSDTWCKVELNKNYYINIISTTNSSGVAKVTYNSDKKQYEFTAIPDWDCKQDSISCPIINLNVSWLKTWHIGPSWTILPQPISPSSTVTYWSCTNWWVRYYKSNNCSSNSVRFTCTNWQLTIWTQFSPAPANPIAWETLYNTQSECLNNQWWWNAWNFSISATRWVINLSSQNTASTTISNIKQENTKVCAEVLISPTWNTNLWYCNDVNHYVNRTPTSEWQYNWNGWNVNYTPSFYLNSSNWKIPWLKVAVYIMDKSTWEKVTWTVNVIWELNSWWWSSWWWSSWWSNYWTCTTWWMKYYRNTWWSCISANFYCTDWKLIRWSQFSPAPTQPTYWTTIYDNSSCN